MFYRNQNGDVQYWDERYGDPPSTLSNNSLPDANLGALQDQEPQGAANSMTFADESKDFPQRRLVEGLANKDPIDNVSPSFLGSLSFPTTDMEFRYRDAVAAGNRDQARSIVKEADTYRAEKDRQAKIERAINRVVMMGLGVASSPPGTYGALGPQLARGMLTGLNYSQGLEQQESLDEYRDNEALTNRARAMAYADQVAQSRSKAASPKVVGTKRNFDPQTGQSYWVQILSDGTTRPVEGIPYESPKNPLPTETGYMERNPDGSYRRVYDQDGNKIQPDVRPFFMRGQDAEGNTTAVDPRTGRQTRLGPAPPGKQPVPNEMASALLKAAEQEFKENPEALGALGTFSAGYLARPDLFTVDSFRRGLVETLRSFRRGKPEDPLNNIPGLGGRPTPPPPPPPSPPPPPPPSPTPVLRQSAAAPTMPANFLPVVQPFLERSARGESLPISVVVEEVLRAYPNMTMQEAKNLIRAAEQNYKP